MIHMLYKYPFFNLFHPNKLNYLDLIKWFKVLSLQTYILLNPSLHK